MVVSLYAYQRVILHSFVSAISKTGGRKTSRNKLETINQVEVKTRVKKRRECQVQEISVILYMFTVYPIRMPARGCMGPITFIVEIKLRGTTRC